MLSFLAAPFSLLPTSLTASIQERLIALLVRQTLGRIFDLEDANNATADEGLSRRAIESDIAQGKVIELRDLTFNAKWVSDTLLSLLPVKTILRHATLSRLSIRIATPISWTSIVSVEVHGLRMDVAVATAGANASDSTLFEDLKTSLNPTEDIAGNLAASILVNDDANTEEHIAEELDEGMPGSFETQTASSEPTAARKMLTALIQRLLSRLSLDLVDCALIFALHEGVLASGTSTPTSLPPEDELDSSIELKFERITVEPEAISSDSLPDPPELDPSMLKSRSRDIKFQNLSLMLLHRVYESSEHASSPSTTSYGKNTPTEAASPSIPDSDTGEDMAMSMAIADLRQSTVEESVYLSADEDSDHTSSSEAERIKSKTLAHDSKSNIALSETRSDTHRSHILLSISPEPASLSLSFLEDTLALQDVRLHLGNFTVFILPWTLEMLAELYGHFGSLFRAEDPPVARKSASFSDAGSRPTVLMQIDSTVVILAYEDVKGSDAASLISKPATTTLSASHFRLSLKGVCVLLAHSEIRATCLDAALTEYSSSLGLTLPVAIFDDRLDKQYSQPNSIDWSSTFIRLPAKDWRQAGYRDVYKDFKGPRRKPHGRSSDGAADSSVQNALSIELYDEQLIIKLSPLHLFVDTDIFMRLSSFSVFLEHLCDPFPSKKRKANKSACSQKTESSSLQLSCDLLRLEIRCPQQTYEGSPDSPRSNLRSGILICDIWNIKNSFSIEPIADQSRTSLSANIQTVSIFMLLPSDSHALSFLHILEDKNNNQSAIDASILTLQDVTHGSNHPQTVGIVVANVYSYLTKPIVDSLQLLIDDVTQNVSHSRRQDEDLVGSRFFGFKSIYFSSRNRREASTEGSESSSSLSDGILKDHKLDLIARVNQCQIKLELPSQSQRRTLPSILDLLATSLEIRIQQAAASLTLLLQCPSLQLWHHLPEGTHYRLLDNLCDRTKNSGQNMLSVRLSTSTAIETGKETRISIIFQHAMLFFRAGASLGPSLSKFVKPPKGAFETAEAAERTRLKLKIHNVIAHFTPRTLPSRIAISLGNAKFDFETSPLNVVSEGRGNINQAVLSMIDRGSQLEEMDKEKVLTSQCLESNGFVGHAWLTSCQYRLKLRNGSILPDFEAYLEQPRAKVSICADSLATLAAFLGDLQPVADLKQENSASASKTTSVSPVEMASVLDADARGPTYSTSLSRGIEDDLAELVMDDVPSNEAYLMQIKAHESVDKSNQSKRMESNEEVDSRTVAKITMHASIPIQFVQNYLTAERFRNLSNAIKETSATLVSVTDCHFTLDLHSGYQWQHTRDLIHQKAMSRRRQLKALKKALVAKMRGHSSSNLEDSLDPQIYAELLPPGTLDLPSKQAIVVIEQQLANQSSQLRNDSEVNASQADTEWEAVDSPGTTSQLSSGVQVSHKRSKTPAIRIEAKRVDLQFLAFPPKSDKLTSLSVRVDMLEILDLIETSTWRKFLAEMRAHDGGIARPQGMPMVRAEYTTFMGAEGAKQNVEHALKIKVVPLRLHVDQDAIDFLKSFAAYKPDDAGSPATPTPDDNFIRRVEILPVKIKLDYKPKRVDYKGLRQGKAIELMNFFHFEGSEMTLRHMTLTGITGWSRVSDMLQDIWTPDVKANQLADVVSGIAPIRSVVNIGSGMADLVLLPIEQYKRDKRVARGLQKGASSFAKVTALEAVRMGARLATGTQVILEQAQSILGSAQSSRDISATAVDGDLDPMSTEQLRSFQVSKYASQPVTINDGLREAMHTMQTSFRTTVQTILAVPMEVYEQSGPGGQMKAVLRAIPIAVLQPTIGAAQAISKSLSGVSNSLDPHSSIRNTDKYKQSR